MSKSYVCFNAFNSNKGVRYAFNQSIDSVELSTLSYLEQMNFQTADNKKPVVEELTVFDTESYPLQQLAF